MERLSGLVLEDGTTWRTVAEPWQREDAVAVLEPAEGAPRMHFETRPRGASKTVDEAGVLVAWLVEQAPEAARAYWVAGDRDQGRLGIDAMAGLVTRSGLSGLLKVDG